MKNKSYLELVREAHEKGWCTTMFCTTCGVHEFRDRLSSWARDDCSSLLDSLAEMNLVEYTKLPNWPDCLRIFTSTVSWPGMYEKLLRAWLSGLDSNVAFADVVLFHIVRNLNTREEASREWIQKCIELAVLSRNPSLIESLVYTLQEQVSTYPDFMKVALVCAENDAKVRRALLRSGVILD